MAELKQNLKGSRLSALEIKGLTGWHETMIEDYLDIIENLTVIAETVDLSMLLVPTAVENNVSTFDATGQVKDSGTGITKVSLKISPIVENNVLSMASDGDMKDSGIPKDNVSIKVVGGTLDNILTVDSDNDMKDSGVGISKVSLKIVGGVENNLTTIDASGDMKDSGSSIIDIENRSTRRSYFYGRLF